MRYYIAIMPWILVPFLFGEDEYERANRSLRYTEKGKELTRIGDVEGAIMDFDEALRLDSENAEAYVYRGKAKAKRKDFDGAHDDYSKAIETNPKLPIAYYERSQSHVEKEDWNGALEDLSVAVELDNSNPDYFRARAELRLDRHDYDGAAEDFERLANLEKDSLEHLRALSDAKCAAGDLEGALEVCNKFLKKDRRFAPGYVLRARLKILQGLEKSALTDYDKAVRYAPNSPGPLLSRGLFFYAKEEFPKARRDILSGLELSQNKEILDYGNLWLWMIDARIGEIERADETLRKHRDDREEGDAFDWPDTVARFLLKEISGEEFLRLAADTDLIKEKEQSTEAVFYIAQTHFVSKRREEAIKRLEACVEADILRFYEHIAAFLQLKEAGN